MQAGRTLHLACIKQALSEGRVGLNSILTHRLRPGRLFEQRTRLRLRCGMENALQWKEEMTSALADRIIGGGDLGNFGDVVRNVWDSLEFVFLFWRSFEGKERKKFKRFVARGSARLIKFMTLWYDGHRHAPKLGNLVCELRAVSF